MCLPWRVAGSKGYVSEEGEQQTTRRDDERPHSVLREGEISHAEVNAALLVWGISVTLVKSDDLLVFRHVREHQSFHTGRTRKTIYMPEKAIEEATNKGYD